MQLKVRQASDWNCFAESQGATAINGPAICILNLPCTVYDSKRWGICRRSGWLSDSMTQWFQRTQNLTKWSRGKGMEPPIGNLYILFSLGLLPAAVPSFVTGQPWIRSWDYKLLINGSTEKVLSAKGGSFCIVALVSHRRVGSTKDRLRRDQPAVLPPHTLFSATCNERSEPLACWGISTTSGWTTHTNKWAPRSFFIITQISSLPNTQPTTCSSTYKWIASFRITHFHYFPSRYRRVSGGFGVRRGFEKTKNASCNFTLVQNVMMLFSFFKKNVSDKSAAISH